MAEEKPNTREIPTNPESALLLAVLYQRLGGSFSIGSNGCRYFGRPEPCVFRIEGRSIPQLPDAQPHEEFHCPEEWRGAIKVVETLLSRLSDADTNLIYDLFAPISVDDRKFIPSIEEPRRPQ